MADTNVKKQTKKAQTHAEQLAEIRAIRLSSLAAAWMLGIPDVTLRNRTDPELIPDADGRYSIEQICSFMRSRPESESLEIQKRSLEIRKLENQVREQEAKYLRDQGLLVERDELKQLLDSAVSSIRSAGDRLARKNKITGTQAQSILNSAIEKLARSVKKI